MWKLSMRRLGESVSKVSGVNGVIDPGQFSDSTTQILKKFIFLNFFEEFSHEF